MSLKQDLIDFRAIKNLSQKQLAENIGLSPTILNGLENETLTVKEVTKRKVEIYLENNK